MAMVVVVVEFHENILAQCKSPLQSFEILNFGVIQIFFNSRLLLTL